jgi:coenzyme F420-0:L-glutamate ligase/coenzyme F420-1:gamma-L-glutamate ligase
LAEKIPRRVEIVALPDVPRIASGDDLAAITGAALGRLDLELRRGDVVVYAQKIVSKSEGRQVRLSDVTVSPRAAELAAVTRKDPRLVELILSESRRVVRATTDVLIVEHRLGFIMANAGIDQSNVASVSADASPSVLLLPEDPDASAARLRTALTPTGGPAPGVVINDSFGRPWRLGSVGVAIGCAGIPATRDLRGVPDLFGRALQVTVVGHADEIAAAASLVMGQAAEGHPIVLVRGLSFSGSNQSARDLLRPAAEDLFR